VVDLSWYGDRRIALPLGEGFHSRRLTLRSSQVGTVSPARADRSYADRLALALELLADPALDALITGESRFEDLPEVMPGLAAGDIPALCHRIRYTDRTDCGRTQPPSARRLRHMWVRLTRIYLYMCTAAKAGPRGARWGAR
jgi:hypothetical protein